MSTAAITQFHLFKRLREVAKSLVPTAIANQTLGLSSASQESIPPQPDSRLLSLPAELRLQVFAAVLGDSLIHSVSVGKTEGKRTRFFLCPAPAACRCTYMFYPEEKEPYLLWLNATSLPKGTAKPSTTLLRASRQCYVEAVQLLYTTNTFRIHDCWTVGDMQMSMPAHRYAQIRSLSLSFSFGSAGFVPGSAGRTWNMIGSAPVTHKVWRETWEVLPEKFPGVRVLEVILEVRSLDGLVMAEEEEWVGPLLCVRQMGLDRVAVRLLGMVEESSGMVEQGKALERKLEGMMLEPAGQFDGGSTTEPA